MQMKCNNEEGVWKSVNQTIWPSLDMPSLSTFKLFPLTEMMFYLKNSFYCGRPYYLCVRNNGVTLNTHLLPKHKQYKRLLAILARVYCDQASWKSIHVLLSIIIKASINSQILLLRILLQTCYRRARAPFMLQCIQVSFTQTHYTRSRDL